jgi:hypothetical protein
MVREGETDDLRVVLRVQRNEARAGPEMSDSADADESGYDIRPRSELRDNSVGSVDKRRPPAVILATPS